MIFRLIEAEKAEHAISRLCSVLGVTRAGYYAWRQRRPSPRELADGDLSTLIGRVFVDSLETYGAPRIHAELRDGSYLRSDIMPGGSKSQHGLHALSHALDGIFENGPFVVIFRSAGHVSMEGNSEIG